jgi:magnesium chelatase subunit I
MRYAELVRHAGSEGLHDALELSLLSLRRGHPLHVHAEGLRGTGKTTIIRAAARLLPRISRICGCPYNCDPATPHCPLHRDLTPEAVAALGAEVVPAPFLEISPSAKIGTVVGSIDLGRLVNAEQAAAALLPGTLARAHRGVVFVDEVNRLADTGPELADALLDVMGTKPGRLQIEETGLAPVVLPVRVTVWAASNPDEEPGPLGDIRRQLADRFDLMVAMRRPADPGAVLAVLQRVALADGEPWPATEPPALDPPGAGDGGVPELPAELQETIARAYCDFQIESLRAVQAWHVAARLQAARRGRGRAELDDLRRTAPLALRHRLQPEELARLLDRLDGTDAPAAEAEIALAASAAAPVVSGPAIPPPTPPGARTRLRWLPWARAAGEGGAAGTGLDGPLSGGPGPAGSGGVPALADPSQYPPVTPRQAARFLGELPPEELWRASRPAGGDPR